MAPRNHLVHHSRGQSTSFTFTSEFLVSPDTPQKLQYLREQAAVIKLFEERFTSIWENVIILAKEGKEDTKQSFQVQENAASETINDPPTDRRRRKSLSQND